LILFVAFNLICNKANHFLQIISNICYLVFKDPVFSNTAPLSFLLFSKPFLLATRGESNGLDVDSQGVFLCFFQKKQASANYPFSGEKYPRKTLLAWLKIEFTDRWHTIPREKSHRLDDIVIFLALLHQQV
jgi:hypothetical protein